MKKEASVILAKCAQDKLYGIRFENRDNVWVRSWAFKLKEETAEKEGFDKINFTGSFYRRRISRLPLLRRKEMFCLRKLR